MSSNWENREVRKRERAGCSRGEDVHYLILRQKEWQGRQTRGATLFWARSPDRASPSQPIGSARAAGSSSKLSTYFGVTTSIPALSMLFSPFTLVRYNFYLITWIILQFRSFLSRVYQNPVSDHVCRSRGSAVTGQIIRFSALIGPEPVMCPHVPALALHQRGSLRWHPWLWQSWLCRPRLRMVIFMKWLCVVISEQMTAGPKKCKRRMWIGQLDLFRADPLVLSADRNRLFYTGELVDKKGCYGGIAAHSKFPS